MDYINIKGKLKMYKVSIQLKKNEQQNILKENRRKNNIKIKPKCYKEKRKT